MVVWANFLRLLLFRGSTTKMPKVRRLQSSETQQSRGGEKGSVRFTDPDPQAAAKMLQPSEKQRRDSALSSETRRVKRSETRITLPGVGFQNKTTYGQTFKTKVGFK